LGKAIKLAKLRDEAAKRSSKRADKKRELAGHAIATLGSLGYARTSLRDIASQSGVSLGILHYYFEDKIDLISYCVRLYKETFIAMLDAAMAPETPADAVVAGFVDALVAAVAIHANTHRLWYDIRGQALFDEAFHPVVDEIERALVNVVARLLRRLDIEAASPLGVYLVFDGLFRYYLQQHLSGDKQALAAFRAALVDQFNSLASPRRGAE